jgi:hypothetical protein
MGRHLLATAYSQLNRFGKVNQLPLNHIAEKVVFQVLTAFLGYFFQFMPTFGTDAEMLFAEVKRRGFVAPFPAAGPGGSSR